MSSRLLALLMLVGAATLSAQAPPIPAPSRSLPATKVVLYKTGIGYFEHMGPVEDRIDWIRSGPRNASTAVARAVGGDARTQSGDCVADVRDRAVNRD